MDTFAASIAIRSNFRALAFAEDDSDDEVPPSLIDEDGNVLIN